MSLRLALPSFAMVRLIIAALSFAGFVVFLVVLLRPPPSMLLPNLPHTGHKVSVVLLSPSPSHNLSSVVTSTGIPIVTALSATHLEAEFIIIGRDKGAETAVKPLRDKGHHVELVPSQPTAMHTLRDAFSRAHFSQILVYGDSRVPMSDVVSGLVQPVVGGKADMAVAEYTDKSSLLGLLSYPLTGSLAAGSNTTVFCLHTAVWQKDCQSVSLTAPSPSLELLAKCDLDTLSSISLPLISPEQNQLRMLAQVHRLYWQLHPVWCSLLSLLLVAGVLLAGRWVWQRQRDHTYKSHTLHTVLV